MKTILAFPGSTGASLSVRQSAGRTLLGIPLLVLLAFSAIGNASSPAPGCAGVLDPYFISGTGVSRLRWAPTLGLVSAMVVQTNGQVIVGGNFNLVQLRPKNGLARFNTDGYVDEAFAPAISPGSSADSSHTSALALQPDGRLLVGGTFTGSDGLFCLRLIRLHPSGSIDTSFAPTNSLGSVTALAVQSDGKVMVAGMNADTGAYSVVRLNPNGLPDSGFTFTNSYEQPIRNLLLLSGGQFLVNGTARFNCDGTQDHSFQRVDLEGSMVMATVLQPDGKILLATGNPCGNYPSAGGSVIRLLPDGGLDPDFTSPSFYFISSDDGRRGNLYALALQPDGRIYVGGGFGAVGDKPMALVARLFPNGELDPTFQPNFNYCPGCDEPEFISALALSPEGKLLAGGWFTQVNGFGRQSLVRLYTADDGCAGSVTLTDPNFFVGEEELYARIFLQRSGNTNGPAVIAYRTFDYAELAQNNPGYAVAGRDYVAQAGLVTFAPGQLETAIDIPILDNHVPEYRQDEFAKLFGVTLAMAPNGSNAAVSTCLSSYAYIYIFDNDCCSPYGEFTFTNRSFRVAEDAGSITLDVIRLGSNSTLESVEYAMVDGTGKAGQHYTAQAGVLSFAPGDSGPHTITVPIRHDHLASPNREFTVVLRNTGAALGTNYVAHITIENRDPGVFLSAAKLQASERIASFYGFECTVMRSGPLDTSCQVQLVTSNGTALAGEDFVTANSIIVLQSGESQKTFHIAVMDDDLPEPDKTFQVQLLSDASGCALGDPSSLTFTIVDDDSPCRILTPPAVNPATGHVQFTVEVSPALQFYVLGSDDLVRWDWGNVNGREYDQTTAVVDDWDSPLRRNRFYKVVAYPW